MYDTHSTTNYTPDIIIVVEGLHFETSNADFMVSTRASSWYIERISPELATAWDLEW
jgi:hypothetical protein